MSLSVFVGSVLQQDAGMVGYRFNTIGVSDGISMGTDGMSFSLQSRDLIADSIETVMSAQVRALRGQDRVQQQLLLLIQPQEAGRSCSCIKQCPHMQCSASTHACGCAKANFPPPSHALHIPPPPCCAAAVV